MEQENAAAEKQPGRERRRLLGAMRHLPPMGSIQPIRLAGFAMLAVSEACTACSACARGCPTQALKFDKNEAEPSFSLEFLPEACIGCELCAHACAPAAITVEPSPRFGQVFGSRDPVILRSGRLVRCDHCRSWMAERPGRKLCDLCEYRIKNPFGSKMPPGLQLRRRESERDKPL
jgi:ferredoxin